MAKTASRCSTGRWSKPAGSRPPTSSAPARTAASSSSAVPGRTSRPLWGKATSSTATPPATGSRGPPRPRRPWGAGADKQAALGEGAQLDGDPAGDGVAGLQDPMQAVEAGDGVDVDVAADV